MSQFEERSATSIPEIPQISPALQLFPAVDTLPIGIFTCDAAGRLLQANRQCAKIWGSALPAGTRMDFGGGVRAFDHDGRPLAAADMPGAEVLRTGKPVLGRELILQRNDGARIYVHANVEPAVDGDGRTAGYVHCLVPAEATQIQAAKLAAIVASSDDAIISKTLNGVITSWNEGASRIFGYVADEMIGQLITKIIPPELLAEEERILAKLRLGQPIDHFETVRIAKDGKRIDISVTVSPIRDRSGTLIGASKVGRDITDRKQAEKLQQLLISELNHRVKNTLATVQSIANQTVHCAKSPADFASSFGGRIQALAKTHSRLTETTWQGAELSALMRDQLSVCDADDNRISYFGPSVMLNPQAALHLSLVIHELATNARKYGALSEEHGRLSIRWMVRTEGERRLLLQWQERGGPSVTVPQTRGFGTNLIERSLDCHGGSTAIRYEAEGLTCDISLSLPDIEHTITGSFRKIAPKPADFAQSVAVQRGAISGRRVLVVDDEPLIAMDIVATLTDEGCEVIGPAATIEKAMSLIETADFDLALLDANLAGDPVDSLAAALTRRKIPFAFVSGYGPEGLPEAFRQATLIKKPFQRQRLIEVVQQLADGADTVLRLMASP